MPDESPAPGPDPGSFEQRAERALAELASLQVEAQEEAERVLADLSRLRFRADQVIRVLKALKLPVPRPIDYFEKWADLAETHDAEHDALETAPGPFALSGGAGNTEPAMSVGGAEPGKEFPPLRPAEEPEPDLSPPLLPRAVPQPEPPVDPPGDPDPLPPAASAENAPERAALAARPGDRSKAAGEANRAAIVGVLERHPGGLSLGVLVKEVGLSQSVVSRHLKTLEAEHLTRKEGASSAARYYANVVPVPRGEEEVAAAAPSSAIAEPSPEQLAKVRDWVVQKREPFTVAQGVDATALSEKTVRGAYAKLLEREVLTYVGMDDLELYEYAPPSGPGAAAEHDARRRREAAADAAGNGHGGGEAVAGTGKDLAIRNSELRKLVEEIKAAGGTVVKASNGHLRVEKNGKSCLIGSTPAGNVVPGYRSRVRKQLGLAI